MLVGNRLVILRRTKGSGADSRYYVQFLSETTSSFWMISSPEDESDQFIMAFDSRGSRKWSCEDIENVDADGVNDLMLNPHTAQDAGAIPMEPLGT